ncbi:polysaccharide biosynthesis protein [Halorubellus sp. JP-L1]|uniref:oligosaccharide flippase family protein n=1 Tax=Halorubellus sp. JP-L1 TaxID=2715753 RepID=UPI001409B9A7|nr:oligosaccharide flippase family protein [Halorubellus sp. JP-L1]NHN40956.1 polysaccharide biosynthesis protein [Halorubellus sp. JP-L1]
MVQSLVRRFASILGGRVSSLLLGLLITPVLVRLLGSSKYGDYAFLLSLLGITMILVNAGIFDGTRKYIAENRETANWTEHVLGFYIRVAGVFAIVAAIGYGVLAWSPLSTSVLGPQFGTYLYLTAALILAQQAFSLTRTGLMGLGLEKRSEPLKVLQKLLFGIFALSLAYLNYGVTGVLIGHTASSIVVTIMGGVLISTEINVSAVFKRIPAEFPRRELLSFNGLSVVLILLTASLYHVDILLLRVLVGSQQTGYYRASLVVAEFLWFVPNTLQMVLLHSSSEYWTQGKVDQISELVSRTTRYNLLFTMLLAIGIAALASDFVPLYFGAEFQPAVLPLLLLLPGAVGFALARPIFAVGQGKGSLRPLIGATGSAAILNIVFNLILIPRYGIAGAAVATSISYGLMILFHVRAAQRIGFNPIRNLRLSKVFLVVLLATPVIFLSSIMFESSIKSLLIVPPTGLLVYSVISLKIGAIEPAEVIPVLNRLPEPFSHHTKGMIQRLE